MERDSWNPCDRFYGPSADLAVVANAEYSVPASIGKPVGAPDCHSLLSDAPVSVTC
jgi:hypothetical protein